MIINIITSLCLSFCTFLGLNFAVLILSMWGYNLSSKYDFDIISIFSLIMFAVYYYFLSKHNSKQDSFIYNKNLNSDEYIAQKPIIGPAKKSFLIGMGTFVLTLPIIFFIYFLINQSYSGGYNSSSPNFSGFFFVYFIWIPVSVLFSTFIGLVCYVVLRRKNK